MNKKILIALIGIIVVIIIAILLPTILNKPKEPDTQMNEPSTILQTQPDTGEEDPYKGIDVVGLSKDLNITEDEVKEILDKPLTGEAAQASAELQRELDNTPEIDHVVPGSETENGKYEIVDVNGDTYEVDDPFAAMTEEELEEYNKKMDEVFAAMREEDGAKADKLRTEVKDIVNQATMIKT